MFHTMLNVTNRIKNKKNLNKIMVGGIVWAIYIMFIILLCRNTAIDSDKANHLLQAQDIINGNFFLSDWNLTGVTFFTTDLLYYEIAYLLCGISFKAICVAGGLMIASANIMAFYAAFYNKEENILSKLLFFSLAMIPCQTLIGYFRVHTGAVTLCFLSYLLTLEILRTECTKKRRTVLVVLLCLVSMMGAIGDLLLIIEGVLAIILFCIFNLIIVGTTKKEYIKVIMATLIGTVLGLVWDKFYFIIGGANKNSYIMDKNFVPATSWGEKVLSFIDTLMELNYADFDGLHLSGLIHVSKFFIFMIGIIAIIFVIKILVIFCKKTVIIDDMSLLITIGMVLSLSCYIFTDMAHAKYITLIPLGLIVIFVRNMEWVLNRVYNKKMFICILILFSIICGLEKCYDIFNKGYPESNRNSYELISFLEEKNLKYGYASFWNASNLTVLSSEEVRVRNIEKSGNIYQMHNWFNKNQWFDEETTFILINNMQGDRGENDLQGVNEGDITKYFGQANQRYEIAGYIVLVYDVNLSQELGKPRKASEDGVISIDELYFTNCEKEREYIILKDGGIVFGPYDAIDPGEYRIEYVGEDLDLVSCDIWSEKHNGDFSYTIDSSTDTSIIIDLEVYEEIDDIEFRTFAATEHAKLKKIIINSR